MTKHSHFPIVTSLASQFAFRVRSETPVVSTAGRSYNPSVHEAPKLLGLSSPLSLRVHPTTSIGVVATMTLDVDPALLSSSKNIFPSLNRNHISEAIQLSPDNGTTLMFSKMNLSDVGVSAAEELASIGRETPEDESPVKRIALGYNRLTTLPTEFALLSQLRYLNLKHNSFSVFPDVLTLMPSLDTLDISHNKIKRFPTQPGQLIHLRVFCLSRNKLTRLPQYLTHFYNLEVLQVGRNPIEWPTRAALQQGRNIEPGDPMKSWVKSLQAWMNAHDFVAKSHNEAELHVLDDLENHIEESYHSWRSQLQENDLSAGSTLHTRSVSVNSNISLSSIDDSFQDLEIPNSSYPSMERPPPLHLGILRSYSMPISPTQSSGSYLPSPVDSEPPHDGVATISGHQLEPQSHARNASYAGTLIQPHHVELVEKKSMPDLRTAKLNFSKKIRNPPNTAPPDMRPLDDKPDDFPVSPHLPFRQDSGSSISSISRLQNSESSRASPMRVIPSMTFERNSYFRRMSSLPTTNFLPKSLLCLIDSARSILFALCQVYQTLEHYMTYAIDDRLSSVLKKVLDPASIDMLQLINSLDRFDYMARKMMPPPALCRSVVESCKDTVAVFRKAVGVLGLQLKVIATGDDPRYSRWILLELYAASAEISFAWQAMIPNIEAITSLLHPKTFGAPPYLGENPITHSAPLPPQAALQTDPFVPLRPQPTGLTAIGSTGRVRTARRHAGSFSSKDVEIGKKLPSYDEIPSFGGVVSGIATHTPTLRVPKRQATVPSISSLSSSTTNTLPLTPITFPTSTPTSDGLRTNHSRQGSQVSLQTASSSSPSVPSKTTFLDLPPNSKTQVDKEAVQAVQAAVEVAPKVWDMIETLIGDVLDANSAVQETLEKARSVTTRLSNTIRIIQGRDSPLERKALREDAHVFLKTVVQLSNIIKTHGRPHAVSSALRNNMVKLTNSTEEFAILLHVSSFSPSMPRSYSPMLSLSIPSEGPDENRLGASLSRSRSVTPSTSFKLPATPQEGPRSALPTQSFKVPVIRRLPGREPRVDIPDPG